MMLIVRSLRWVGVLVAVLALVSLTGFVPGLRMETLAQVYGTTPVAPMPSGGVLTAAVPTPAPAAAVAVSAPAPVSVPAAATVAPPAPPTGGALPATISPPSVTPAEAAPAAPSGGVLSATGTAPAGAAAAAGPVQAPTAPAATGELPVRLANAGTGGALNADSTAGASTMVGLLTMLGLASFGGWRMSRRARAR